MAPTLNILQNALKVTLAFVQTMLEKFFEFLSSNIISISTTTSTSTSTSTFLLLLVLRRTFCPSIKSPKLFTYVLKTQFDFRVQLLWENNYLSMQHSLSLWSMKAKKIYYFLNWHELWINIWIHANEKLLLKVKLKDAVFQSWNQTQQQQLNNNKKRSVHFEEKKMLLVFIV